jgi:hypothetical protein
MVQNQGCYKWSQLCGKLDVLGKLIHFMRRLTHKILYLKGNLIKVEWS